MITSPDLSEEDLSEASRTAHLEETIDSFSRGYETFVGERGVTLSGGQKQRAAIARMLTQKAPIMIFDDSLSAVDTETDAKIRILEGHVDLLKAIAAQIGNKAAAVVNARIAAIETTAKSVGRNRQADRKL